MLSEDAVDTILNEKVDVICDSSTDNNDNFGNMKILLEGLLARTTNTNLVNKTLAKIKEKKIENVVSHSLASENQLSDVLIQKIRLYELETCKNFDQFAEGYYKSLMNSFFVIVYSTPVI